MVDIPDKILIIRLSSIGDILLTSPVLRQIKKKYPETRLDFIVKLEFEELLKYNPHIDNIYTLDLKNDRTSLKKIKNIIRKNRYDIIFDLHNNLRSNYLRRGSRARSIRKIYKNKLQQILLVKFHINIYRKIIQIPQRYLNVMKDFKIQDDGEGLEIFWEQKINESVTKKSTHDPEKKFICIAPGAAHFTKRWPGEYFKEVCEKILKSTDYQIIILGGNPDITLGKFLSDDNRIFDFTGRLSLLESANILSRAKALITNDTGLMHMGTAVNTPVVAIFGSTVESFGFFPYKAVSKVLEVKGLNCRPCTHIGRRQCPKEHFRCMTHIKPDDVLKSLNAILGNRQLS